jgi:WD40 repeat protein
VPSSSSLIQGTASLRQIRTLRGHSAAITDVAFSHKGDLLATTGSDCSVLLWKIKDQFPAEVITVERERRITDLAIAGDGQTVAAICGRDKFVPEVSESSSTQVKFWDIRTGRPFVPMDVGRDISTLAFCSDGQLAVGSEDGRIELWNWRTRMRVKEFDGHQKRICDMAFAPKQGYIASGSEDGTVMVWDANTGEQHWALPPQRSVVQAVAFSPDGKTLATGSHDHLVRLWNIESRVAISELQGHTSGVLSLAYSPDGQYLASSSWDHTICVWEPNDPQERPSVLQDHSMWVSSVWFSSDPPRLFSASGDRTLKIWDRDADGWQQLFTLNGHTKAVTGMAVSPDGNVVASGGRDSAIRLWRAAAPEDVSSSRWWRDYLEQR